MECNLLLCAKCFIPMKPVEVNNEDFEAYHLRILEERVADKLEGGGVKKFNLTFWECDCIDKRKVVAIS